ncbi:hypothetical protein V9T40_007913 [Parthenolecanium corni]|uniref:Uncharacterized protein n=1 Tax=Parthenolecanium corni TaxID=536013 RepID=A0AAN9TZT4_9HEMI
MRSDFSTVHDFKRGVVNVRGECGLQNERTISNFRTERIGLFQNRFVNSAKGIRQKIDAKSLTSSSSYETPKYPTSNYRQITKGRIAGNLLVLSQAVSLQIQQSPTSDGTLT